MGSPPSGYAHAKAAQAALRHTLSFISPLVVYPVRPYLLPIPHRRRSLIASIHPEFGLRSSEIFFHALHIVKLVETHTTPLSFFISFLFLTCFIHHHHLSVGLRSAFNYHLALHYCTPSAIHLVCLVSHILALPILT